MNDAEEFDELAKRQGHWGGGYQAKKAMAADKLQEPTQEPVALVIDGVLVKSALPEKYTGHLYTTPPQPAQEPEMLTISYQSGYHDGKKAALAGREWNFCERCGKRTADKNAIHTCTPPQGDA